MIRYRDGLRKSIAGFANSYVWKGVANSKTLNAIVVSSLTASFAVQHAAILLFIVVHVLLSSTLVNLHIAYW